MKGAASDLGTAAWSARTGGHLTTADKASLLGPLARTHAVNAAGRLAMAVGRRPGRRRRVEVDELLPPRTNLTRVARDLAAERLTPALLNHSERMYAFGAALAVVEGVDVERELLYAACLLHDVGLNDSDPGVDFTVTSAAVAAKVAEDVGLSDAGAETIRSAITLHHSPGVTLDRHGPVAYLVSAGASIDVVGFRAWHLPPSIVAWVVDACPREGFKSEFGAALRRVRLRHSPRPIPELSYSSTRSTSNLRWTSLEFPEPFPVRFPVPFPVGAGRGSARGWSALTDWGGWSQVRLAPPGSSSEPVGARVRPVRCTRAIP
jgi:hypothetical protein